MIEGEVEVVFFRRVGGQKEGRGIVTGIGGRSRHLNRLQHINMSSRSVWEWGG